MTNERQERQFAKMNFGSKPDTIITHTHSGLLPDFLPPAVPKVEHQKILFDRAETCFSQNTYLVHEWLVQLRWLTSVLANKRSGTEKVCFFFADTDKSRTCELHTGRKCDSHKLCVGVGVLRSCGRNSFSVGKENWLARGAGVVLTGRKSQFLIHYFGVNEHISMAIQNIKCSERRFLTCPFCTGQPPRCVVRCNVPSKRCGPRTVTPFAPWTMMWVSGWAPSPPLGVKIHFPPMNKWIHVDSDASAISACEDGTEKHTLQAGSVLNDTL